MLPNVSDDDFEEAEPNCRALRLWRLKQSGSFASPDVPRNQEKVSNTLAAVMCEVDAP